MAWPSKVEAKDILGMETAEFQTQLNKVNEIEAVKTEVGEMKGILSNIQASLATLNTRPNPAPVQNNNPAPVVEEVSFLDDPEAAVNDRINKRVTPIITATLDTRAAMEFDRVGNAIVRDDKGNSSRKFPYWDVYRDEIKKLVDEQPLAHRCNPAIIENAYKVVVGNHVEDISNHRVKGTGMFAVESASNNGITRGGTKIDELSEVDKIQASKFGMKPEDWLKAKGKLEYVGI